MTNEVRQIVVSLPKRNGDNIKRLLREVSINESRSISNLVCLILTNWLVDKGYQVDEVEESNQDSSEYEISSNGNVRESSDDESDQAYGDAQRFP